MSELSRKRESEEYEACDDDNQQELIESLKERETNQAAGLSPQA